jgi:hypothetical protein
LALALEADEARMAALAEAQRKGVDELERRQFVAGVVGATVAPIATVSDLLYVGYSSALDHQPAADEWEARVESYGPRYMTAGAAQLHPCLAEDLVMLQASSLDERRRWATASKLLLLYAKTVAGADNASRWHRIAVRAADRSTDLGTRVWVRGRAALSLAYEGAAVDIATLLASEALALSDQPSLGRLNALMAMGQVQALRGDRPGALQALTDCRRLHQIVGSDEQMSEYAVPEWRFHMLASMLLSRLGDRREAMREQDAADRSRPASLHRFGTHVEMHRGLMLVRAGDRTGGVEYARAALAKLPAERQSMSLRLLLSEVEASASGR